MGNNKSNINKQELQSNQAYGDFQIIHSNDKTIAKVTKLIEKESGLIKLIESSLNKRRKLKHQNICQLYQFNMKNDQFLIEIDLHYQYHGLNLGQKYKGLNQYIAENELMKIIEDISSALRFLYSKQIKHGCINLSTILSYPNGYKITDVSSTSCISLNYQDQTSMERAQQGSRQQPISRKVINFINQITIKPLIIKELALEDDLFSLGMVALSLATNTSISQFYHHQLIDDNLQITLRQEKMADYLYLLKKRYNKHLYKAVNRLIFNQHGNKKDSSLSMSMQIRQ